MGMVRKIASISGTATGPTSTTIEGTGAFNSATFWVDIPTASSNTTSSWTVAVEWKAPSGHTDQIAASSAGGIDMTSAGLTALTNTAPFADNAGNAIPRPNVVTVTRTATSSGTAPITGELWAAFAD